MRRDMEVDIFLSVSSRLGTASICKERLALQSCRVFGALGRPTV